MKGDRLTSAQRQAPSLTAGSGDERAACDCDCDCGRSMFGPCLVQPVQPVQLEYDRGSTMARELRPPCQLTVESFGDLLGPFGAIWGPLGKATAVSGSWNLKRGLFGCWAGWQYLVPAHAINR